MTKIKCSHCGYENEVDFPSGGVVLIGNEVYDMYGNHNCPDGEIGILVNKIQPGKETEFTSLDK